MQRAGPAFFNQVVVTSMCSASYVLPCSVGLYSVPHPEMSRYFIYHARTRSVLGHVAVLKSEDRRFSGTSSIRLSSLSRKKLGNTC